MLLETANERRTPHRQIWAAAIRLLHTTKFAVRDLEHPCIQLSGWGCGDEPLTLQPCVDRRGHERRAASPLCRKPLRASDGVGLLESTPIVGNFQLNLHWVSIIKTGVSSEAAAPRSFVAVVVVAVIIIITIVILRDCWESCHPSTQIVACSFQESWFTWIITA